MPTVAEQLLLAREAQSLTIYQVAEVTKIRTDHTRALEAGNFDVFSAPVYIRGFVRSYAVLLKLDVAQVMATLDGELSQTKKFREPPSLTGQPRGLVDYLTLQLSKVNWRVVKIVLVALAMIAVVAGIVMWRQRVPAADPVSKLPPAVYQSGQPAGETLPLPAPKKP